MSDNINAREVEILKTLPESEVMDFIEKNWARLRSLIEEDEYLSNLEIIELLKSGYSSL